jgi:ABC-type phosphate transport system substrate-binding protein
LVEICKIDIPCHIAFAPLPYPALPARSCDRCCLSGCIRLASNSVDFTTSDGAANAADFLRSPDVVSIPTAASALVFPYNLPGVTGTLVLTIPVAVRMFMGNITFWNDPAISSLNPSITLPSANITLIARSDLLGINQYLYTAFAALSPQWATNVKLVNALIQWPNTDNIRYYRNSLAHGNALSTVPYSFGYMLQDEVNHLPNLGFHLYLIDFNE